MSSENSTIEAGKNGTFHVVCYLIVILLLYYTPLQHKNNTIDLLLQDVQREYSSYDDEPSLPNYEEGKNTHCG